MSASRETSSGLRMFPESTPALSTNTSWDLEKSFRALAVATGSRLAKAMAVGPSR
jgi:hypothetical protein